MFFPKINGIFLSLFFPEKMLCTRKQLCGFVCTERIKHCCIVRAWLGLRFNATVRCKWTWCFSRCSYGETKRMEKEELKTIVWPTKKIIDDYIFGSKISKATSFLRFNITIIKRKSESGKKKKEAIRQISVHFFFCTPEKKVSVVYVEPTLSFSFLKWKIKFNGFQRWSAFDRIALCLYNTQESANCDFSKEQITRVLFFLTFFISLSLCNSTSTCTTHIKISGFDRGEIRLIIFAAQYILSLFDVWNLSFLFPCINNNNRIKQRNMNVIK